MYVKVAQERLQIVEMCLPHSQGIFTVLFVILDPANILIDLLQVVFTTLSEHDEASIRSGFYLEKTLEEQTFWFEVQPLKSIVENAAEVLVEVVHQLFQ